MMLSPKQKLIMTGVVSAAALGACLGGFWRVASGVIRDDAVRGDIQARLDRISADRQQAQELSALRALRQDDISYIGRLFVDRASPVLFLRELENIGRVTGTAVAIEVNDAGSDAAHLGFRVTVEGGRRDAVRYLRIMERMPYVMTVTEINEEKKSPDGHAATGPSDRLTIVLRARAQ